MRHRVRGDNRISERTNRTGRGNGANKEEHQTFSQKSTYLVQNLQKRSLARHRAERTTRKNPHPYEDTLRKHHSKLIFKAITSRIKFKTNMSNNESGYGHKKFKKNAGRIKGSTKRN